MIEALQKVSIEVTYFNIIRPYNDSPIANIILNCEKLKAFPLYNEWGPLSSRGAWAARFAGFSCCRARAVAAQASVVAACGLSGCDSQALEYPVARGTFPNQESNLCPLHWQVDSSPLEVPLNVVSTCTLQLIHEIKLLFPCLLTVWIVSFVKCLFKYFIHF